MSSTSVPKVVPAQLSFLAVYNPALGTTDETFHRQVVFYYSRAAKARSRLSHGDAQAEKELREQENEKLRQVGLAQGMVGFAKSFSNGEAVDSVDTEKSRIVLREIETGWWILASIDLTQLPAPASRNDSSTSVHEPTVEYSSREVSPPALLVQQIVRAHAVFQLHHGATLDAMFAKHKRDKFCNIMEKHWARFASSWDVLLHGSPAVDIFGGMKLAAGGELGMGVGEEEWGSSERDVLEDFARRTDGLVDVMVSRFGEASPLQHAKTSTDPKTLDVNDLEPWVGSGRSVNAPDGVVFSGLGALSRSSLRDMSHWIETLYSYGDQAYGVRDNPTSDRKRRKRRTVKSPSPAPEARRAVSDDRVQQAASNIDSGLPPGIPPPIVKTAEASLNKASAAVDGSKAKGEPTSSQEPGIIASLGDTETWMKYVTLGYGTAWGGSKKPAEGPAPASTQQTETIRFPSPETMRYIDPTPDVDFAEERLRTQIRQENDGYFLVGLKGDMGEPDRDDENEEGNWNNRILLRTVYVEVKPGTNTSMSPGGDSDETLTYDGDLDVQDEDKKSKSQLSRLRPVVYVHRPFIYTFLFAHRTSSLSFASFYRDIHTFFSPLHRSLEKSTSPQKVAARLLAAANPHTTVSSTSATGPNTQPIFDLVYDPRTLTVHSSLPNIPDPGTLGAEGLGGKGTLGWGRVDALNVHSQLLATVADTRRSQEEIERTCKTSRGWWVVWMRLPPSGLSPSTSPASSRPQTSSSSAPSPYNRNPNDSSQDLVSTSFNTADLREAFLVRRARDSEKDTGKSGSRFASGMWSLGIGGPGKSTSERMGGATAGWGPKGLAEGIGIDARRYVEELLSLNR